MTATPTQLDLLDLPGAWADLPQDPATATPTEVSGDIPTPTEVSGDIPTPGWADQPGECCGSTQQHSVAVKPATRVQPPTAGPKVAQNGSQAAKRGRRRPQPGHPDAYLCEVLGRWYWRDSHAGCMAHRKAGTPPCEACLAAARECCRRWRGENRDLSRDINRRANRNRRAKLVDLRDGTGRIDFAAAGYRVEHGTANGYAERCRCGPCKQTKANYNAARKAHAEANRDGEGRLDKTLNGRPVAHGTRAAYTLHFCRCEGCRAADRAARNDWAGRNPDKVRAKDAKRRALERDQLAEDVAYQPLYEQANGRCGLKLSTRCTGTFTQATVHVDHVLSLHYGGLHREGNLWAVCSTCNESKGSRIAHHVALIVGWWHPPAVDDRLAAATTFEEKLYAVLSAGRPEAALKRDMNRRNKFQFVGRAAQVEALLAAKLVGTALDPAGKRRLFGRKLKTVGNQWRLEWKHL